MFKRRLLAFMLFVVFLTLVPTLVSATPSPIRYYLKYLGPPLYYGLQNTQPTNPVSTYVTWTLTWTGTSDWSYVTDTTEPTEVHLILKGSVMVGSYGFTWTLKDETTAVTIASGSFVTLLTSVAPTPVTVYDITTASASVAMTDTISFTLTCTSWPAGATYYQIFYSGPDDTTTPYDSWIDVPEAGVAPSIPEFSLTIPVVTSLAATIYLALRKRIWKRVE